MSKVLITEMINILQRLRNRFVELYVAGITTEVIIYKL